MQVPLLDAKHDETICNDFNRIKCKNCLSLGQPNTPVSLHNHRAFEFRFIFI